MSNKTFNMSTDQVESTVPLPHRGLQLGLSPERHYSNSSMSPSPDSNSSISNVSDREASSSPDINILEYCHSEDSSVDNPYDTSLPQGNVFGVNTNMNQTFVTHTNDSVNIWNENLSLLSIKETGKEKLQTFNKSAEDGSNSFVLFPLSAEGESQRSSRDMSRRGSTENECYSLSSEEMVMRSNSFYLEDQSLPVISSLEESSVSPDGVHPALSAESNLLLTTLPVCENSSERIREENGGPLCLGKTLNLPSENEGGLFMTFICEISSVDSSVDSGKELANVEGGRLTGFPDAITPEQRKTFMTMLSTPQDTDENIHTSTPVQNIENNIPSLPSFSESPCNENASSSGLHAGKRQSECVTPKRLVAALLPSASKVKKIESKKLPKSDMSNTKSKTVTRTVHQMAVSEQASHHKPSQGGTSSKHTEAQRAAAIRISDARVRRSTAAVSTTTKMLSDNLRQASTTATKVDTSSGLAAVNGRGKSRAIPPDHCLATNNHASTVQCSNVSSEVEQEAAKHAADTSAQHAGNQTFCIFSFEKSLDRSDQTDPQPAPTTDLSNKIEVGLGSALKQDKSPLQTLPCSSLKSSSLSKSPKKTTSRFSVTSTVPKTDNRRGQTKPGNQNCSSQNKAVATKGPAENYARSIKKISLMEPNKSTVAGASCDESKSRLQVRPSSRQMKASPLSQRPAFSPRQTSLSTRERQGTLGRDESRTSKTAGTPQTKRSVTGSQRAPATRDPALGMASASSIKPQLNGAQPPRTPARPSPMGPPPAPAARSPHKTSGHFRSLKEANVNKEAGAGALSTHVSGGAAHKQTSLKAVVLKARLTSTPGKNSGQTLTTTCKPVASTSKGDSNPTVSPLRRPAPIRLIRLASSEPVDKNKSKASFSRQQPRQQSSQSPAAADVVPASVAKEEKKDQRNQQLTDLLTASNCRFEALTIVVQQIVTERDEARRQCRELSQELVNLRGDLVCSIHSSERLEKEKEELRVTLEDALQRLQRQHQKDVSELEQKLQAFYQAELDKIHQSYQEEADKCKALMQQQIGDLKANHEAMKRELQSSHTEQLQCVEQQYEMSLEGLRKVHNEELQSLEKTLTDAQASLSGRIEELTAENNALIEKLTAEQDKRKELAEKCQKDSHMQYLEQELESLKVVLDIKNKQLHQQEKKLMEIDNLIEKSVKLDENLKKVQQENEDLKARMERHATMSRQLSTEQAVLQECLQKESKVNKRLSMENEELLWKLHNGDLSSPRKVSPTSPSHSHSFSLQSPRSSGLFSSPPVSPR